MRFAENNRISHRQLFRQIILVFPAPFLLCLFQGGSMIGKSAVAGTVTAAVILLFYVIWLIRLGPAYSEMAKTVGNIAVRFVGLFFLVYVILSAAFLADLMAQVVPSSLISGISGKSLSLLAVAACSIGTHRGMQRRGRIAEVSGGIFLAGIILLMILSAGQGKTEYFLEVWNGENSEFSGEEWMGSTWRLLSAFSGVGLLPFALDKVEKQGSARKPLISGLLTVCGVVLGMQILLPAVFGRERLFTEVYPILPLLDGADLPGNVLARFDVIWMGFLVFGLFFSMGSLFHYGNQIAAGTKFGTGRYWIPAAGWILSVYNWNGYGIRDYYGSYLGYVFVPGLLVIQLLLSMGNRGHRRKKVAAAALLLAVCLTGTGCAAVEPEKRIYPLALGAGALENGFILKYAMPDMNVTTGQEKPDEDPVSVLTIAGANFNEIEKIYNRSQEKYPDLGHLQVVILDENMLTEENRAAFIHYLKQEEHVGEDVYVFRTHMFSEVFGWKGAQQSSVGEYLQGIQENRTSGQQKKGVTLREVYHQFYKDGTLPWLPSVWVNSDLLEVDYGNGE
mgnify:FL=1